MAETNTLYAPYTVRDYDGTRWVVHGPTLPERGWICDSEGHAKFRAALLQDAWQGGQMSRDASHAAMREAAERVDKAVAALEGVKMDRAQAWELQEACRNLRALATGAKGTLAADAGEGA